jgi:hypothetical protein
VTAEELISDLRERGFTPRRSTGPGFWVILPRVKADDPIASWLGKHGANMRGFQPEYWTDRSKREYEAVLSTMPVAVEEVEGETKHELAARRRLAIWEAAA